MPYHSFDRFLAGISDAMKHAQFAGRRLRQSLLDRRFGSDTDGPGTFPVSVAGSDGWSTLDTPIIDLMQRHGLGVTGLDLELDCELRLVPPSAGGRMRRVAICVRRGGAHRLEVRLRSNGEPTGKVLLDGFFLRHLSDGAGETQAVRAPSRNGIR